MVAYLNKELDTLGYTQKLHQELKTMQEELAVKRTKDKAEAEAKAREEAKLPPKMHAADPSEDAVPTWENSRIVKIQWKGKVLPVVTDSGQHWVQPHGGDWWNMDLCYWAKKPKTTSSDLPPQASASSGSGIGLPGPQAPASSWMAPTSWRFAPQPSGSGIGLPGTSALKMEEHSAPATLLLEPAEESTLPSLVAVKREEHSAPAAPLLEPPEESATPLVAVKREEPTAASDAAGESYSNYGDEAWYENFV